MDKFRIGFHFQAGADVKIGLAVCLTKDNDHHWCDTICACLRPVTKNYGVLFLSCT
jgi:hypothetical protein